MDSLSLRNLSVIGLAEEIPDTYGPRRSSAMYSTAATAPYSEPGESKLRIPVMF